MEDTIHKIDSAQKVIQHNRTDPNYKQPRVVNIPPGMRTELAGSTKYSPNTMYKEGGNGATPNTSIKSYGDSKTNGQRNDQLISMNDISSKDLQSRVNSIKQLKQEGIPNKLKYNQVQDCIDVNNSKFKNQEIMKSQPRSHDDSVTAKTTKLIEEVQPTSRNLSKGKPPKPNKSKT